MLSASQRAALAETVPQNDEELWYWVRAILGVAIPRERVCENHRAPFEAFADAYFARAPIAVWKASRGFGGKSFLLSLLSLTESITLRAAVNLLGGSLEQSKRVLAYLNGTDPNTKGLLWDAPLAPRYLIENDLVTEFKLSNGGNLKALAASQKSVRGPHPQRLRLDEVDEMKLSIFDAAMGQTMSARGVLSQTVAASTHQNPDGTFSEILKRAGSNGWPFYEWCYRESLEPHGWLEPAEVERKRSTVSAAMWQVEYEGQEPNPEGRAIDADALENLFDRRLGEFDGREGERIVLVPPSTADVVKFAHGADWAKSSDWTILHSLAEFSSGPDRLAAWLRLGRRPWPYMVAQFNARLEDYGGPAAHDATGVGEVVDDYLERDSIAFDFRHKKKRDEMLTSYIAAIERGELVYPAIRYLYSSHKFATVGDLYGSGSTEHLPDDVAAGALAYYAKREGLRAPRIREL